MQNTENRYKSLLYFQGRTKFIYSERQLLTFGHIMDFSFSQFSIFFQKVLETDDTSFESPKIELLESSMKLGMA